MRIRLEITVAPDHTFTFEHAGPTVRIGRAPECELHLPAEGSQVSWHHARLDLSADGLWLFDLNSTNGTILNDHHVEGPQRLQVGDRFQLGYTGAALTVVEFDDSPVPFGVAETGGCGTENLFHEAGQESPAHSVSHGSDLPVQPHGTDSEWSNLLTVVPEEEHSPAAVRLPARKGAKGRWLPGAIVGAVLHLIAAAMVLYWMFGRPTRTVPDTRPRKTPALSKPGPLDRTAGCRAPSRGPASRDDFS